MENQKKSNGGAIRKILITLATLLGVVVVLAVINWATGACSVQTVENKKAPIAEVPEQTSAVIEYAGTPDLTTTPQEITVIDFNATWCGPCKKFAPIFHSVAEKYQGKATFYSVDVDNNPELAEFYAVDAIPKIVVLFPDGTINDTVGLITAEELEEMIGK